MTHPGKKEYTMESLIPEIPTSKLGTSKWLTEYDVLKLKRMYNCRETNIIGTTDICTAGGQKCTFPFKYEGKSYNSCTEVGSENGKAWCALAVDARDGVVI